MQINFKKNDRIAITACSNALDSKKRPLMDRLKKLLIEMDLDPVFSKNLFLKNDCSFPCAGDRAEELTDFFKDESVTAVFDVSGGDIANEILEELDFAVLKKNLKPLFGYSDLTTVLNAFYTKTGNPAVLYHIANLIRDRKIQSRYFYNTFFDGKNDLFNFSYHFVRGSFMQGVVVGGNLRCFLKLAGTEYFPDLKNKILLLEANTGLLPQMITYLSQLKQLHAFDEVSGVLLGTFTQLEEKSSIQMEELIFPYLRSGTPVAKTYEIGHGADSKAAVIGEKLTLTA